MKQPSLFRFIMLSAMYENGGNMTHRLFDGHPNLFVYPFESQPGTKYVNDYLSSLYPFKYRWPVFPITVAAKEAYQLIIDEEGKIRSKTPYVSKFRDVKFEMIDKDREEEFVNFMKNKLYTRANLVEAFFRTTFLAWKNYNLSGKETHFVGYSPIITVDADKIINDYQGNGYVLHIVRNPFSAYADNKKRPVPLSIAHYTMGWITCQYHALIFETQYPNNFFVLRYEDIIDDPKKALGDLLKKMQIPVADTLCIPSWNGQKLTQVYPWGTIRIPTNKINLETALELNKKEIEEIYMRTKNYLPFFNYESILSKIK